MQKRDNKQIMWDFKLRQSRQLLAIGVTMFFILLLTLFYKHPDYIGEFSKNTIFTLQSMFIAVFIGFSAFNWRCPSCKKYLGNNIARHTCKKCGARLQQRGDL
jgi:hypothetical protein